MVELFQIFTLLLVAIAMALSLAHALELPGKMRLDKQSYLTVQPIYYPGFTYGGFVGEIGGMAALAILLTLTPVSDARFWWLAGGLAALVASHLTYWLVTHPVNGFWLKDVKLGGAGRTFFGAFAGAGADDWRRLRDRWEYSHVARACLTVLSFLAVAVALSL